MKQSTETPIQRLNKKPRIRPDPRIIKTNESKSYSDVLKSQHHNNYTLELRLIKNFKKPNLTGDFLMTVAHRTQQITEDIIKRIEETLGKNSSVRQLRNNKLIQVNNLDGITFKEEVIDAIHGALGITTKDERIIVRNLQV